MSELKPTEVLLKAAGAAGKEAVASEPSSELAQRLWQRLLVPLPAAAAHGGELAASAASAGSSPSSERARGERERDATSQLTSAAHLLAGAVHQLGFMRYGQHANAAGSESHAAAFNVRLSNVDGSGGLASIDIPHPQLGDIGLEIELSNGAVRVLASAATEHSAQVLLAGQALLAERLLKQGIVLEALDVVVAERETGSEEPRRRARGRATRQER